MPLVIPIGVDAEAGPAYLEAVCQLHERYGPDLHITGGLSSVSFGMPARRLISDVFLDLCVQAGQDSGIVNPVAADIARALAPDRDAEAYRLAADLLTGADAFGVEFIDAFRSGRGECQKAEHQEQHSHRLHCPLTPRRCASLRTCDSIPTAPPSV